MWQHIIVLSCIWLLFIVCKIPGKGFTLTNLCKHLTICLFSNSAWRELLCSGDCGQKGWSCTQPCIYLFSKYLCAPWVLGMVLKLEDTVMEEREPLFPINLQCWISKRNPLFNECYGTWIYVSKSTLGMTQVMGLRQTEWNKCKR